MPAPASEFRFSIKYTGAKAARLASGTIPPWEVRSIFKNDLTALGANHPKSENIQQGPSGSIYFIYTHDKKTFVRIFGDWGSLIFTSYSSGYSINADTAQTVFGHRKYAKYGYILPYRQN
jgi:hypothetical protein